MSEQTGEDGWPVHHDEPDWSELLPRIDRRNRVALRAGYECLRMWCARRDALDSLELALDALGLVGTDSGTESIVRAMPRTYRGELKVGSGYTVRHLRVRLALLLRVLMRAEKEAST